MEFLVGAVTVTRMKTALGGRVGRFAVLSLILLATGLTYRASVQNGFVWDDVHTVVENPLIRSVASIGHGFSSPYVASDLGEANYRPLLMASYALDYAWWNDDAAGYHATNLAIHLAVVGLVYLLARRLWSDSFSALVASTVVALHPLNAEAVNYIAARSSSLTALWVLAALAVSDVSAELGDRLWRRVGLVFALVLGAAALWTKETAVILPLLVIVWGELRHPEWAWRTAVARSLPWWGLVGVFLVVRTAVLHGAPIAAHVGDGPWQPAFFAIKIALSSFGFWLYPVDLAIDHAWRPTIGTWEGAGLVTGLAVAMGATYGLLRVRPRLGWCVVWFWVALLPLAALPVVSRTTLYQDHRVYLAGIGLAWLVGAVSGNIVTASRLVPVRVGGALSAIGLIVVSILANTERTTVWQNSDRLWQDIASKYPQSDLGPNALGLILLNEGQLEDARRAFERSVRLAPYMPQSHNYLGIVEAKLGRLDRAVTEFETAVRQRPYYAEARLNLGKACEELGRPDLALRAYEEGMSDGPWAADTLRRSAWLLKKQGRLDEALDRYRRLLQINPDDQGPAVEFGALLIQLERWPEARVALPPLVGRHPAAIQLLLDLGAAFDGSGEIDRAVETYQKASALKPSDPEPYFRTAVAYARRERWEEAAAWYRQALDRDPGHVLSRFHLALVLERLGQVEAATAQYRAFLALAAGQESYGELRKQAEEAVSRLGGEGKGALLSKVPANDHLTRRRES